MSNPDRTIILDLAAIEEARGPHPNDFFICLTRREAAAACYAIARMLDKEPCDVEGCPNCNAYRRLFWDCANELGPKLQEDLFRGLDGAGIAIPDGPWEETRG